MQAHRLQGDPVMWFRASNKKVRGNNAFARRRSTRLQVEVQENRTLPSAYVVTTTADSGPGSLRDAIIQVNADTSHTLYTSPSDPNKDEIDFQITGSGVQTIMPLSALPAITNAVIVDGTTQCG